MHASIDARLHAALHAGDGVVNRWLRGEYKQDPWNREAFRRFERAANAKAEEMRGLAKSIQDARLRFLRCVLTASAS